MKRIHMMPHVKWWCFRTRSVSTYAVIMGLHFCFHLMSPKNIPCSLKVIRWFSCWSTPQAEKLKDTNHCDILACSFCWKKITFSDRLNESSWTLTGWDKEYWNDLWQYCYGGQYFHSWERSTKVSRPCLEFPEIFSCCLSNFWK